MLTLGCEISVAQDWSFRHITRGRGGLITALSHSFSLGFFGWGFVGLITSVTKPVISQSGDYYILAINI